MKKLMVIGTAALALAACSTSNEYHYWQRNDPNSALYLTGVKAQQVLEQDISYCVHSVIELTKLADVRGKVPSSFQTLSGYDQMNAEAGMSNLPRWDVPEHIRNLRVDHTEYHDFDGCMSYKGWQRVRYVAPKAEFRAKEIYRDTGNYSVRPHNTGQTEYNDQMKDLHKPR